MKHILTSSTLAYLRFFAKKALAKHQPTIIGIAGSVGKTSTRHALEAILRDHFPTQSVGNSETGIPLGILGMKPEDYSKFDWLKMLARSPFNIDYLEGTKYLIAEMGIDEPYPPKNMEYLLTILKPDIAISLNVSATHSLQFDRTVRATDLTGEERLQRVIHNIAEEDTKIISKSDCKVGIYNADDVFVTEQVQKHSSQATKLLTFGTKSDNDVSYKDYQVSLQGTTFKFYYKEDEKRQEFSLHFARFVLPEEYREVFASAILAALQTGLSLQQIITSLEKNYELPKGRATLFQGKNNTVIIDSTYNASKASATAFLDLVDSLKKDSDRSVVMLLGDMRELGEVARIEHEEVSQKLIGTVDYLYLVGPLTREYVLPIIQPHESQFKEVRWFDSAKRAGEFMKDNLPKHAIVLAKGSQNTIFLEEAVKELLLDKNEAKNLCRQDDYWKKIKSS